MTNRRTLLCVLLTMALTILLAACGEEKTSVELTELSNWQQYTIVRPDEADSGTVDAAIALNKALEEKLGGKLTLTTDWIKRGEEPPAGTLEILVGKTNRPESAHDLQYQDYLVEFTGNRLVITGGSGEAVMAAMDWYLETCIAETVSVPASQYRYEAEYPLENVTINGIALKDYSICTRDGDETARDALRAWLIEATGYVPANNGDNQIRFGVGENLAMEEISVTSRDGHLWLETSEYGYGRSEALACFMELVEGRESDIMQLNERIVKPMEGFATATAEQLAAWQKQADELRQEILDTPNMEIPEGAAVYYVSENGDDANDGLTPKTAWKTIERMSKETMKAGSYVCFERGGMYRGKFSAQAGVTYTAYGEGDKPYINGSPFNGAEHGSWTEVAENVWMYSELFDKDVGGIVFNEGEAYGIKTLVNYLYADTPVEQITKEEFKGLDSLVEWKEELRFWHDHGGAYVDPPEAKPLYVYCSEGNPGEVYDSIEFLTRGNIISIGSRANITIDNLCIKNTGSHGIGAGTCKNLTVTNCEIGDIGGGHHKINTDGRPSRFGNGIEIYGGCENYVIDHCWVYQCYDAGITHQLSAGGTQNCIQDSVTYTNNLIEDCVYNIEYFLGSAEEGSNPTRYMSNVLMKGNILLNAGYGWGEQRPDRGNDAHIKGWDHMNTLEGDFIIEDNLFLYSKSMMIHIGAADAEDLPTFRNNVFAQTAGGKFGRYAQNPTSQMMYTYDTVTMEAFKDNEFFVVNE